ncbi:unnamed protein product [Eruca vesicaria subsp. sativa]|uniref:DUF7036 domain-containing protein n=1 Tax=Eruca vesicaria subsp. sativa TaxID=29727 RepID=A0ABC8IZP6_ERUVS|nr:unnamed protein product [Eruca vesicaria subsp. sativa]
MSLSKTAIQLSREPENLGNLNRTMVVFAIDPEKKNAKIPTEIESLIKAAFVTLVENQFPFRLTESLFG